MVRIRNLSEQPLTVGVDGNVTHPLPTTMPVAFISQPSLHSQGVPFPVHVGFCAFWQKQDSAPDVPPSNPNIGNESPELLLADGMLVGCFIQASNKPVDSIAKSDDAEPALGS